MASTIRSLLRSAFKTGERFNRHNGEAVARLMLADARTKNDRHRREFAARVIRAYFADNLEDFAEYLKRFAFTKPEEKAQIKGALVRKYAYSKSQVFNARPTLAVHVNDEIDDRQTSLLNEIMQTGRWFESLQQASRFEKIVNTVNLHLRPVNGTALLEAITPDETVVFQDPMNPSKPFAVMYRLSQLQLFDTPHEEGVTPELWAFWTAEQHFMAVVESGLLDFDAMMPPADNPEMVNPYGVLPFVKVQNERPGNGEYWGPLALDVWLAEMSVSAAFVATLEAIIEQGFSLTFSSGFPESLFTEGRGTGSHYNVEKTRQGENTPTFGSVKLDSSIAQMVDGADAIAQHVALMRGLSPQEFSVKQAAESGFSKLVDLAPQFEERQGDVERWTIYLKELFGLLKVQWPIMQAMPGFDAISNEGFSEDAHLFVSFAEPKVFETPKERLDRIAQQMDLGLMSPVGAMQEIDPDLSVAQAENHLREVSKSRRMFEGSTLMSFAAEQDAEDDQDATQAEQEMADAVTF